jgi:O-antigen/teichoic acid export membrane protein
MFDTVKRSRTGIAVSRLRGNTMVASGLWGTADQVLISAVNFVTMALLARHLGPAQFGVYTLVFTYFLMANGFQQSFVSQPHNTIGPSLDPSEYQRYTASTAAVQVVLLIALSFFSVIIAVVMVVNSWSGANVILAMVPALCGWQIQEFLRRVQYTRGNIGAAFGNDILAYGAYAGGIVILYLSHELSASRAYLIMGLAHLFAAMFAAWSLRNQLMRRPVKAHIRANWDFGIWLAASGLTSSAANMAVNAVVAVMLGTPAVGAIRTVQNLVAPTQILGSVYRSLFGPLSAREHASHGTNRMLALLTKGGVLTVGVSALYFVMIGVFVDPMITLVYSSQYVEYAWIIWYFIVTYLLLHISIGLALAMGVLRKTRALFWATSTGALVNVLMIVPLTGLFGLAGAMASGVVAQMIITGVTHGALIHALRRESSAVGDGSQR